MSKIPKKKIFYIADFSLPNMSAYTLHVLKMCDAFSEKNYDTSLLIPYTNKDYSFEKIKKEYVLKSYFCIESLFKKKIKRNLIYLTLFTFKIFKFLKSNKKKKLIISRSVVPALLLALIGKKIILEIHTEPQGFTKIIFFFHRFLKFSNRIQFILINKNLNTSLELNKYKFIVLDDCVDVRDFKKVENKDKTCVYTGSFVKGKGIETIIKIAKNLNNIDFHLYGNLKTLDNSLHQEILGIKNIILNNFVPYYKITEILPKSKILLMPYEKKVGVLINDLDVSNYISPLKLFDYLASGSIIVATKKEAYSHILKNEVNCYLVETNQVNEWCQIINKIVSKMDNEKEIQKNSIESAKNYSWLDRVQKINNFYFKN